MKLNQLLRHKAFARAVNIAEKSPYKKCFQIYHDFSLCNSDEVILSWDDDFDAGYLISAKKITDLRGSVFSEASILGQIKDYYED